MSILNLTFTFSAMVIVAIGPFASLGGEPSIRSEGVSQTFESGDEEAKGYAEKAKDALEKGLVDRALLLAKSAESLKWTRETTYLMACVYVRRSMSETERGLDAIRLHGAKLKLTGENDQTLLATGERFLNWSTESLEQAKGWMKEMERLDKSYKNSEFLKESIKKAERANSTANDTLAGLKSKE